MVIMETCKENMKRNHLGVYSTELEGEMIQAACWSQIKKAFNWICPFKQGLKLLPY